jgi:Flp pilus assembly protein TadD
MALVHATAGRYEQTLNWVERTLHVEPGNMTALRHKAALCARLDRIEEARTAVRQLLEAQPWLTVARSQRVLSRILGPELAAMHADALCKAGLPEE